MRKLFPIITVSSTVIILTSLIIGSINNKWFFLSRLKHLPHSLCFDLDTMRNYLQAGGKANVTIYFSERSQKTLIDCMEDLQERESDGSYKALSRESKQELIKLLAQNIKVSEVNSEFGEALLFKAIYEGEIDTARFLMESGVNVNTNIKHGGWTPLHSASHSGNLNMISLLIEYGADFTIQNRYKITPLKTATQKSNIETVKLLIELGAVVPKDALLNINDTYTSKQEIIKLLLKYGADINAVDSSGETLVFKLKNQEDIEFILNNGAEPNIKDKYGKTALFSAQNQEIAKLLIDRGVDINVRDRNGDTALSLALKGGKIDVAKYLIEQGADVSEKYKKGISLLSYAPNREIAELLIERGVDLHEKNSDGTNALVYSINLEKAMLLVEKGININAIRNGDKSSALSLALRAGKTDIAKYLIEQGADVHWKGYDGQTLLFYARTKEIAKMLVDRGLDINAQDDSGYTALFHAVYGYRSDLVEYLIEKGADVHWQGDRGETLLFYAQNKEIAQLLIDRGVDINQKDDLGVTAFYTIIQRIFYNWDSKQYHKSKSIIFDLFNYFIQSGADINLKSQQGKTLLFYVRDKQIAQLLIESGVDINARDNNGMTALHQSININDTKGNIDLVKYIINNGAEINTIHTDKNGISTTPLIAAFKESNDFGEFLIANGADINYQDDRGINILTMAIIEGRLDIAESLIDNGAEIQYLNDKNLKNLTPREYQKYKNSQFTQSLWTNKLLQLGELWRSH